MIDSILLLLVFTLPAFALPVITGPFLLVRYRDRLGKLASWFTLKPLFATPLWILSAVLVEFIPWDRNIQQVLTLVPAILLTGIIVFIFKKTIEAEIKIASVLIVMDALRWLNTYAWLANGGKPRITNPYLLAGWILPNLYAVIATVMVIAHHRKQNQLENEAASEAEQHAAI